MATAKREPRPRSREAVEPHIFAANVHGDRDWRTDEPIDCLYCPFPKANAIHESSAELVEGLPPTPVDAKEIDDRKLGEG